MRGSGGGAHAKVNMSGSGREYMLRSITNDTSPIDPIHDRLTRLENYIRLDKSVGNFSILNSGSINNLQNKVQTADTRYISCSFVSSADLSVTTLWTYLLSVRFFIKLILYIH
jgi:hypothetical protein